MAGRKVKQHSVFATDGGKDYPEAATGSSGTGEQEDREGAARA